MTPHTGHRRRVKQEFLAKGMEGWADHRVLEMLLFYAIPQGDVNILAHALMDRFGTLAGVFDAPVEELERVSGMGQHSAILVKMIPQIGRAYLKDRAGAGILIRDSVDAVEVLRPYFYGARNEMIYILCLDGKGKTLGVRKLAEGSIEAAEINTRRLVEEALGLRAVGVYVAHNHLSNLAFPSQADWSSTDAMGKVLQGVGIELKDHIIFSDDDAVSLAASRRGSRMREYYLG